MRPALRCSIDSPSTGTLLPLRGLISSTQRLFCLRLTVKHPQVATATDESRLEGVASPLTLVSVIVPAFNAERTIDRTLASARAQTHAKLEIIVINDGSTDSTEDRVLSHAGEDPRVRLVHQPNGGVAAARNRGIVESRADFLALLDADDLWHPEKIACQLAVLEQRPEVALVATTYSVIDREDRVIAEVGGSMPRETQFLELCRRNFIGNGSSALIRREAVERFGGYDPSLRGRGAQGCEDLKLYLQIAELHDLSLIPEPLTAYRRDSASMSGNTVQMLRSFDLVADEFCRRRPELRPRFNAHRVYMLCWLINGALSCGKYAEGMRLAGQLISTRSLALPGAVRDALGRRLTAAASGRRLRRRGQRSTLTWADQLGSADERQGAHEGAA